MLSMVFLSALLVLLSVWFSRAKTDETAFTIQAPGLGGIYRQAFRGPLALELSRRHGPPSLLGDRGPGLASRDLGMVTRTRNALPTKVSLGSM